MSHQRYQSRISPEQKKLKQRVLAATVITCIALAMVAGTLHVVQLGANRMADMRDRATYDLSEMKDRLRAAGEDITRHREHKKQQQAETTYAWNELEALLTPEQWAMLDEMIQIPAGPFSMGTDSERANSQDRPQHEVMVEDYWIDKYPVTNAKYARFIVSTKRRPPLDWDDGVIPTGRYLYPVTMVSWYDAQAFCRWEIKRLPLEEEWEKAARGTDGRRWPWGNKIDPKLLNTYYSVGSTTDVTNYVAGASPYGVFDMAGNVSEWTASDFEPYEGSDAPRELFKPRIMQESSNPVDRGMSLAEQVEVVGVYKVRRGGSWKSDPFSTSVYHRNYSMPHYASNFFGFRCAKSNAD